MERLCRLIEWSAFCVCLSSFSLHHSMALFQESHSLVNIVSTIMYWILLENWRQLRHISSHWYVYYNYDYFMIALGSTAARARHLEPVLGQSWQARITAHFFFFSSFHWIKYTSNTDLLVIPLCFNCPNDSDHFLGTLRNTGDNVPLNILYIL